jgi:hypothetical protein
MKCAAGILIGVAGMALCGCGGNDEESPAAAGPDESAVHARPETRQVRPASETPAAPIIIDYEILGVPVVGIPLSINVAIASELDEPLTLNYRINEATGLEFAEGQSETILLSPVDDAVRATEQVTVIPQREGRLYLNVSAEVETGTGRIARVMAIPIQVDAQRAAPTIGGE